MTPGDLCQTWNQDFVMADYVCVYVRLRPFNNHWSRLTWTRPFWVHSGGRIFFYRFCLCSCQHVLLDPFAASISYFANDFESLLRMTSWLASMKWLRIEFKLSFLEVLPSHAGWYSLIRSWKQLLIRPMRFAPQKQVNWYMLIEVNRISCQGRASIGEKRQYFIQFFEISLLNVSFS